MCFRNPNQSRWSLYKALKQFKFYPYTINRVQELTEDDFDIRIEYCESMTEPRDLREQIRKRVQ